MIKKVFAAVLAAAAAGAVTAPALAAETGCWAQYAFKDFDSPPAPTGNSFCPSGAWFHKSDSRIANQAATVPSWDAKAPTATFQSAGAFYFSLRPVDIFASSPQTRPTFTGTYTGKLENLALTVYQSSPVYVALGGAPPLYSKLTIDGKLAYENAVAADPEIKPATQKINDEVTAARWVYTGLDAKLLKNKKPNETTTVHTITISFANKYYGDGNFAMLFDGSDYPSGLEFNRAPDPDTLAIDGYTEVPTS